MKYKLLDLFCGAGGATKGYQQCGFYVVGVDIKPQPNYCGDEFYQADALDFPLDGFDAIHFSPPCQAYIQRNKNIETAHPKLIAPMRERVLSVNVPYILENVPGAPLNNPVTLCGTMFDLLVLRHRLFESNIPLNVDLKCNHWGTVANGDFAAVYAFGSQGRRYINENGERVREHKQSKKEPDWGIAMGIDWMTKYEMSQSIPPAYTYYLGMQLMRFLIERD